MPKIEESKHISGVFVVTLQAFGDGRGRFEETFRKEWFPQRSWEAFQVNRSDSKAGVLRGLHYHHQQVDYWYVMAGRIRAGLVDLRHTSPTYLISETIEMGEDREVGLFIPIGVAHGYLALTDATIFYVVDNYYRGGADEFGVAWNDPELGLDWNIPEPILSARDAGNPRLRDIPPGSLPDAIH